MTRPCGLVKNVRNKCYFVCIFCFAAKPMAINELMPNFGILFLGSQPAILYDAEIAVLFAILLPVGAAQEHW
jgi:hypothetical protein